MSSVVGIDLGYQNSVIAVAGRGGVDVVLNGNSQRLNPYVATIVGSSAVAPAHTLRSGPSSRSETRVRWESRRLLEPSAT